MARATFTSWKTLPLPSLREHLGFSALFSGAELETLMQGLIPREMEDKWFIYFREGWLLFHRSWTGACVFGLRLDSTPEGASVSDSWVSRDPTQYKGTDSEYDRKLVRFLIDAFLLRRPVVFPLPSNAAQAPPEVVQHAYVGRGFPESPSEPPSHSGDHQIAPDKK